jgi:signal transduction histidine kinase
VPIALSVPSGLDLPVEVGETAYFVVSEAVSNIMKHSEARTASIHVSDDGTALHVTVHDDGRGGADIGAGSGLAGMAARVHGVDGRFELASPDGGPTTLSVDIPHG